MAEPTLYLMLGYPGAGKTTVATLISNLTGATHLWADHERSKRFEHPTYSHEENLELYKGLNKMAGELLTQGKSVVFDTNFSYKKDRDFLRSVAAKSGAKCKIIWVQTPREIAKTRATEDAHLQGTRLLGNMPEEDFDRMSDNLEEPGEDEQAIKIDGIDVTKEIVAQKLGL